MFAPAGGGVSIVADKALELMVDDEKLIAEREEINSTKNITWWWD